MIWAHHAGPNARLAVGLFCSTGGADSSSFQEPEFLFFYQSSERIPWGLFPGWCLFIYFFVFINQCVTIKERVSIWIMISTGAESKGKVSWSASQGFEPSMHWLRIDLLMYRIHVSAVYFVWHFSHILMWFSLLLWQSSENGKTLYKGDLYCRIRKIFHTIKTKMLWRHLEYVYSQIGKGRVQNYPTSH